MSSRRRRGLHPRRRRARGGRRRGSRGCGAGRGGRSRTPARRGPAARPAPAAPAARPARGTAPSPPPFLPDVHRHVPSGGTPPPPPSSSSLRPAASRRRRRGGGGGGVADAGEPPDELPHRSRRRTPGSVARSRAQLLRGISPGEIDRVVGSPIYIVPVGLMRWRWVPPGSGWSVARGVGVAVWVGGYMWGLVVRGPVRSATAFFFPLPFFLFFSPRFRFLFFVSLQSREISVPSSLYDIF